MFAKFKAWWVAFRKSFHDSEVIVFARLQLLGAVIWGTLTVTDLSPLLEPKYVTLWLLLSGAVTEYAKRRRTEVVSSGELVPTVVVEHVETETGMKL
jgi:hypothetical protein